MKIRQKVLKIRQKGRKTKVLRTKKSMKNLNLQNYLLQILIEPRVFLITRLGNLEVCVNQILKFMKLPEEKKRKKRKCKNRKFLWIKQIKFNKKQNILLLQLKLNKILKFLRRKVLKKMKNVRNNKKLHFELIQRCYFRGRT